MEGEGGGGIGQVDVEPFSDLSDPVILVPEQASDLQRESH
jgi:hypothetical protein